MPAQVCYCIALQQNRTPISCVTCAAQSARITLRPAPRSETFMPRDTDKDNDSRGRRDRPTRARSEGGKGRSGAARGPEKKFAKRGTGGKDFGAKEGGGGRAKRPFDEARPPRRREDGDAPRKSFGDKPRFNRDERPRGDRPHAARPARAADGQMGA